MLPIFTENAAKMPALEPLQLLFVRPQRAALTTSRDHRVDDALPFVGSEPASDVVVGPRENRQSERRFFGPVNRFH